MPLTFSSRSVPPPNQQPWRRGSSIKKMSVDEGRCHHGVVGGVVYSGKMSSGCMNNSGIWTVEYRSVQESAGILSIDCKRSH